jgi:hypothetical protein
MPLVQVGRDRIAGLITGAQTCHWGTSGATLFVASSTSAHSGTTTWLGSASIGATGESGFPLTSANILQYRGVYSTAQANFQWESWLLNTATASGSGIPLNVAAQQALGTKANTQSWQFTACITVTTAWLLAAGLLQMLGAV